MIALAADVCERDVARLTQDASVNPAKAGVQTRLRMIRKVNLTYDRPRDVQTS